MATNEPTNQPLNNFQQFDTVSTQILQTFQTLINQLIARRDALLHKLSQLRDDFTNKETTRLEAIRELEKTRKQLEEMSLRVNKNISIHQQATQLYQEGLDNLQTPTKLLYPLFQCQTLKPLQSARVEFGLSSHRVEVPNYSSKNRTHSNSLVEERKGRERTSMGLYLS